MLTTRFKGDALFKELLLALVSGAPLIVPTREQLDPRAFLSWMCDQSVTIVQTVPSLMAAWLAEVTSSALSSPPRLVALAGEPVHSSLVAQIRKMLGERVRVFNFYGPTETSITKVYYEIPDQPAEGFVPAGQPMEGAEILIVDPKSRPVRAGLPGEIVIRTPYMANGYLGDVTSGYDTLDGQRIYRTGDLGKIDREGRLQVTGRRDDEFKILGNRIHPEEVRQKISHSIGFSGRPMDLRW